VGFIDSEIIFHCWLQLNLYFITTIIVFMEPVNSFRN